VVTERCHIIPMYQDDIEFVMDLQGWGDILD
jgi:hypothetical protein